MDELTTEQLQSRNEDLLIQKEGLRKINKELRRQLEKERRIISMLKASEIVTTEQLELLEAILKPLEQ